MRVVQRVALAARAGRASGRLTREAWQVLLAKTKWHANAAGIACVVQSMRGWRDASDFWFVDEKGQRRRRDGATQLSDAIKALGRDGFDAAQRRERLLRIAWMMLAD